MQPNPQPPHQPPAKWGKQLLDWGNKTLQAIFILLRLLKNCLGWMFGKLTASFQRAKRTDKILAVILLLLWIAILLGNFYVRGNYIFEGNLVVKEMSFTYTGQQEKRFLNPIPNLKNLDIQGSQPQPITLTGKFSSTDPALNQKLSKLNQLTIDLPSPTSRLILTPVSSTKTSELAVLELRIQPEIQVNQLTYNPQVNQLSFCLQSVTMPPEACLFPESLSETVTDSHIKPVGSLKLELGQQPLKVSLGTFKLRELGIQTDPDSANELSFQFIPKLSEPILTILSPTRLFIDLPNLPKAATSQNQNLPQWIRGNIDVKGVSFSQFDITENVTDELKTSTILDGEVRMDSQSMKLQSEQFLILPPKEKGIRKLRYIQINTQPPEGLRTLISGKSTSIAVGLYPEFPVQKIELSWLSKHLSQEAINAILAFIAAFTGVLLPRLFPEPPKKPNIKFIKYKTR